MNKIKIYETDQEAFKLGTCALLVPMLKIDLGIKILPFIFKTVECMQQA